MKLSEPLTVMCLSALKNERELIAVTKQKEISIKNKYSDS